MSMYVWDYVPVWAMLDRNKLKCTAYKLPKLHKLGTELGEHTISSQKSKMYAKDPQNKWILTFDLFKQKLTEKDVSELSNTSDVANIMYDMAKENNHLECYKLERGDCYYVQTVWRAR
jgi:hypothetical protein